MGSAGFCSINDNKKSQGLQQCEKFGFITAISILQRHCLQ
jgi:hypothetical protein